MFTGLIRDLGRLESAGKSALKVRCRLAGVRKGDSIAVNGACLTVTKKTGGLLSFDVSAETWRLTNLGALRPGAAINLEPSLRAGDALGGHLVSGHVDARAAVLEREEQPGGFARLRVALPGALRGLAALKGSIAVDGVSLTVTGLGRSWFETVLVPHTLKKTSLGARRAGDLVNLEADMLARYVKSLLKP
jgi:riboflavin synthase